MMRIRPLWYLLACLFLLVGTVIPSVAMASEGPSLDPQRVFTEGFEGTLLSRTSLTWATPTPGDPSPAYWGKVTQRKHSGSYGLWCAGSVPGSTTNGWTKYNGKYPAYTAGVATLDVPELTDYYSATLGFWYDMPSVGAYETDRFNVLWAESIGNEWDAHTANPIVSAMTQRAYSMTSPTSAVNLSRTAGRVRFLFIDNVGDYESPSVGEGPSIDDISVTGYKFGPVRNLLASVNSGQVTLNWTVPARSTALLAAGEERPVAYRVWRSPDTAPYVWTEVTSSRLGATTFTDTDPLDGHARYIVQAWDPGVGTGYGEVDLNAAATANVVPPIPVSNIVVNPASGPYTQVPSITVSRSTAKGTTYYRWDAGAYAANTLQSFPVAGLAGTHTLEVYSTNTLGNAESPTVKKTITVTLPDPGPAPVTSILVDGVSGVGGTYNTTPTIQVTRDQASGTTYYRWEDSQSFTATTSASFELATTVGTHTLEVYSVSSNGVQEDPTVSRTFTFTGMTRPILATPTLSTSYVRRYRYFYVRGRVLPFHDTDTIVKLPLYRYYKGHYRWVKTYTVKVPKGTSKFSLRLKLSTKTYYRIKVQHSCSLHLSTYSLYKKFYVH